MRETLSPPTVNHTHRALANSKGLDPKERMALKSESIPKAAMAHTKEKADVLAASLTMAVGKLTIEFIALMATNPKANQGNVSLLLLSLFYHPQ